MTITNTESQLQSGVQINNRASALELVRPCNIRQEPEMVKFIFKEDGEVLPTSVIDRVLTTVKRCDDVHLLGCDAYFCPTQYTKQLSLDRLHAVTAWNG